MIKVYAGVILMTLTLAACTPVAVRTTSIADSDPLRRAIVEDVAESLSDVFESSVTPLSPLRPMTGPFDVALTASLRAKGFDLLPLRGRGEAFDCRVDPIEGNMFRVTVRVGKKELSRLWVLDGATAYAGGAWAHRE